MTLLDQTHQTLLTGYDFYFWEFCEKAWSLPFNYRTAKDIQ
jgi:hypothetical protein